ncbi:DUF6985 domain-containing protein [Campylobacter sputorum]|uniref:DUF6985 domain-containing protein n=1 Tax=Campylobacter sputorum TaxID=206 RepID=UPI000B77CE69|nr:hypothetical protein [Campylobacter sputorum]ASM37017.1 hypothetical protein CSF_1153 [Campylobacter sputorum bv. faecalis CCUG 20703]
MKTINDKIFGELVYKHSWKKNDKIIFFEQEQDINIIVKAYNEDDGILESQRENYLKCKKFIAENTNAIYGNLQDYCKKYYEVSESIEDILTITSLYFGRDGAWGILFESKYDVEDGLAIFFKDDKMIVDTQNILL